MGLIRWTLAIEEAIDELGTFGFAAQCRRDHCPSRFAAGEFAQFAEVFGIGQPGWVNLILLGQLESDVLHGTIVGGGYHHFEAKQAGVELIGKAFKSAIVGGFATILDEGVRGLGQRGQYVGSLCHHCCDQVAEKGGLPGTWRTVNAHYAGVVTEVLEQAVDCQLLGVH